MKNYSSKKLFALSFGLTMIWVLSLFLNQAVHAMYRKADTKVISSIDLSDFYSGVLAIDLIQYVVVFFAVYLCFSALIWFVTIQISKILKASSELRLLLLLIFWGSAVAYLLMANGYSFPQSKTNVFSLSFLSSSVGVFVFQFLQWALLISLVVAISLWIVASRTISKVVFLLLFISGIGYAGLEKTQEGTATSPNIIFVGIDSLRIDMLGKSDLTPNVSKFIQSSAYFENAYTPLARTYPAWMSLLTGQYPKTSGTRYNLIAHDRHQIDNSLAVVLAENGYDSVLAIDERRFANIGTNHGFSETIGPKMGAGDFIFAEVVDSPAINLLTHTKVGKYLLPYNYLNRAATRKYIPSAFDEAVAKRIRSQDKSKPLFLSAHFCLPHWPYGWSKPIKAEAATPEEQRWITYKHAIREADRQFKSFMDSLEDSGLLTNALVVFLSDHGESHGESFVSPDSAASDVPMLIARTEYGHGTNVLRDEQYRIALAIRAFGGDSSSRPLSIQEPVSLVDVVPTISELAGIPVNHRLDGRSLKQALDGKVGAIPLSPIYLESGFSVPAIHAVNPNITDVIKQGFQHYSINPATGRLEVKDVSHKVIMDNKQRSIVWNGWQLVHMVGANSQKKDRYILRRLSDNQWTRDLDSPLAGEAPLTELLTQLKHFYGDEIREL